MIKNTTRKRPDGVFDVSVSAAVCRRLFVLAHALA